MKTKVPLFLGLIAGLIGFSELYITWDKYRIVPELFLDFAIILASVAFIMGGINLVQVNYPKVRRREQDWQYKVILLGSALLMFLAGIAWHEIGEEKKAGSWTKEANVFDNTTQLHVDSMRKNAIVIIDGKAPLRAWHDGNPEAIELPPGKTCLQRDITPGEHTIHIRMPIGAGYLEYKDSITASPGDRITVHAALPIQWGQQGRVFTWIYDHMFVPCNATMFSLLAFFIASAAFRAFRARNVESALLLIAAVLVMLGLVPVGRAISPVFPAIEEWIMTILNTAGRRAIMMGAALGGIATGLRIILGIERSHLGSE